MHFNSTKIIRRTSAEVRLALSSAYEIVPAIAEVIGMGWDDPTTSLLIGICCLLGLEHYTPKDGWGMNESQCHSRYEMGWECLTGIPPPSTDH